MRIYRRREMMDRISETNKVLLKGKVISGPVFSHKSYGEAFYIVVIGVMRKSGYEDQIRLMISERLLGGRSPVCGRYIEVQGQIRTYNREENGKNRLEINIFVKEISYCGQNHVQSENCIEIEGYVCKEPIRRKTPLGRELCDLMIAVNRAYNKSDYIPAIAWGTNAFRCELFEVGEKVKIKGRIQSREYRKLTEKGVVITKTAYEVSVSEIEAV